MSYVVTPSRSTLNPNPNPSWNEAYRAVAVGLLGAHKWNFISALLPAPVRHLLQLLLLFLRLRCGEEGREGGGLKDNRDWPHGSCWGATCQSFYCIYLCALSHCQVGATTAPHTSRLSPFLGLFVCALNEMKIAAHCEALRAANRRAKFHFITKAKAEWKNRKPKRKKKLEKRKTKI